MAWSNCRNQESERGRVGARDRGLIDMSDLKGKWGLKAEEREKGRKTKRKREGGTDKGGRRSIDNSKDV